MNFTDVAQQERRWNAATTWIELIRGVIGKRGLPWRASRGPGRRGCLWGLRRHWLVAPHWWAMLPRLLGMFLWQVWRSHMPLSGGRLHRRLLLPRRALLRCRHANHLKENVLIFKIFRRFSHQSSSKMLPLSNYVRQKPRARKRVYFGTSFSRNPFTRG